jgi:SAM-dependent methyltransferase
MPTNPHHYTLRTQWHQQTFDQTVQYIRSNGYQNTYQNRTYTYLNINGYKYWTMGSPIPETTLINRAALTNPHPYDKISETYDTLFIDHKYRQEDTQLYELIQTIAPNINHGSVLEIGCGASATLNHLNPQRYLGIDPSVKMLELLKHRHPQAATLNATLYDFAPPKSHPKYDHIIALYGTASYLNDQELQRIPTLLQPGGKAILMYYTTTPETHLMTKTAPPTRHWHQLPEEHQINPQPFNTYMMSIHHAAR